MCRGARGGVDASGGRCHWPSSPCAITVWTLAVTGCGSTQPLPHKFHDDLEPKFDQLGECDQLGGHRDVVPGPRPAQDLGGGVDQPQPREGRRRRDQSRDQPGPNRPNALKTAANGNYQPQLDAVQTALQQLQTAAANLTNSQNSQNLAAVGSAIAKVGPPPPHCSPP